MNIKTINDLKEKIVVQYYKLRRRRMFNRVNKKESSEEGLKVFEEIINSIEKQSSKEKENKIQGD